jgi:hypothetical protein
VEVVLPFEAAEYRRDFSSAESRAEFEELLGAAAAIRVSGHCAVPPVGLERDRAYEACGRAVVDASDVLVAVWDGLPAKGIGGTAEIIAYARERGRRVIRIDAGPPFGVSEVGARTGE